MGSVVQLKKQITNAYTDLLNSVDEKLSLVEDKISYKLDSKVELVKEMTAYHMTSGGKRLRALLTLECAKLCGYTKGSRDVNLAACVELIHAATLMHDDVIDSADLRRGKKTTNKIWGNQSSILVGDYLLSRCFEMMVEDGSIEVLKLLSSTSSTIAQGEVLQLQHKGDSEMLEETYLNIISSKTAALFSASSKVGSIITDKGNKFKDALEFYGKNLGLTFQIADDTLDYNSELKMFGKEIGKDFFEGKVTLPIILLNQKLSSDEKLVLKNKKMICQFVSNKNDPFYNSEKFQSLLKSINTNPEICELKEKKSNKGDRLLLIFKNVCTVQDGIDCLKIL